MIDLTLLFVVVTSFYIMWVSQFLLWVFSSLFTDEEIQTIRNMTFHDILVAVTSAEANDIQTNVFFWRDGTIHNMCVIQINEYY